MFQLVLRRLCVLAAASLALVAVSAPTPSAAAGDVAAALKEAGVAALPEFLDAATESITIKFPKALGGGTLTFGGTVDVDALAEKRFVFTTSDDHKLAWNDAFGMTFLDLSNVALNLSVEKGAFSISLEGGLGGAFRKGGKPVDVVIDVAVEDKKLGDFTLSLPETKLSLHAVPELKSIPGSTKFAIEAPTISMHAIGGKVDFLGETVDAVVFYDAEKKDWNIGLRFEKALTLAELTGHKGSFLEHVGLPKMRFLASTKGLQTPYGDLPLAAQNFFSESGSLPEGDLGSVLN